VVYIHNTFSNQKFDKVKERFSFSSLKENLHISTVHLYKVYKKKVFVFLFKIKVCGKYEKVFPIKL
jgi:hypothetical protein